MVIKAPEFRVEIIFYTPDMAAADLEKANTSNRKISQQWAEELANDMRLGKWRVTSDSIGYDRSGRLVDGQHRLWAVVLSGIGQWFTVVYDCDERNGEVRDRKRRDAMAIFQARKTPVTAATVAAVKSFGKFIQKSVKRLSDGDVVLLHEQFGQQLHECQKFTKSLCSGSGISYSSSFAVGYFVLGHYMQKKALDELLTQILGSLNLTAKTKVRKYNAGLGKGGQVQNKILPEKFIADLFDLALPGEYPGNDSIVKFIKEKYHV